LFGDFIGVDEAIKKLQVSNDGLKVILENLDEQLADICGDPRLEGLVDDLVNLFYAYLKIWIKSNSEIIDLLKKKNNFNTLKLRIFER